jgi:hypothetical protein
MVGSGMIGRRGSGSVNDGKRSSSGNVPASTVVVARSRIIGRAKAGILATHHDKKGSTGEA